MNVYYVKTALYAYPHIEAILEQIDDLVLRKALSSMSDFSPCEEQCEKILDFTWQKDVLCALKLMVEKALNKLSDMQKDMLDYKYFKQKPKECFIGFDVQSRGYFRRQVALVKKLGERFDKVGLTDEWFDKNCMVMDFFVQMHKRIVKSEQKRSKKQKQCAKFQPLKLSA